MEDQLPHAPAVMTSAMMDCVPLNYEPKETLPPWVTFAMYFYHKRNNYDSLPQSYLHSGGGVAFLSTVSYTLIWISSILGGLKMILS